MWVLVHPGQVVLPKYLKKTSVYHNNEAKVNNVKSREFLSWHNIGLRMGSLQLFVLWIMEHLFDSSNVHFKEGY
jgi:hypothetical protein